MCGILIYYPIITVNYYIFQGAVMLASFLISVIFCAVCVFVYHHTEKHSDKNIHRAVLFLAVAAAAGIRIFFAFQDYYFTYDVSTFKAWGSYARDLGLMNLYSADFFLDYPPGYMYVLYLLDLVCDMLGFGYDHIAGTFIFKLPAMIADFGCAAIIYKFAKEKLTQRRSAFLAVAYLFIPNVVFVGSIWGQVESWYLFFLALSLYYAYRNKTVYAAVSYAVALVTKPQALLFGPVLLFYIVKKKDWKELFRAVGSGLAMMYALVLPFCRNPFELGWLIDLYKGTFQGYEHLTINGFNLYYLLGFNWQDLASFKGSGQINFYVICLVIVFVALICMLAKDNDGMFAACAVSITVIFAFCTMMHERYVYPAVLFCILSYIVRGRKAYLVFGALTGCLNYINSSWVMAMYYQTFALDTTMEKLVSASVVLCAVSLAVYTLYDVTLEKGITFEMLKKPQVAVTAITFVYALFAFNMLGAAYAPQTFWQSTDEDFSFRVHFDQPAQIGSIYVYSGLGDEFIEPAGSKVCGEFDVFVAGDDGEFNFLFTIEDQSVFTWKEYHADVTASTVLVQSRNSGAVLGEIVITDIYGNTLSGTLDAIHSNNPYGAEFAVDEGHMRPFDTGYYNSMYFDEIYHGRTAFEQLQGYSIYETTHPPLGKILISLGIQLLGMTPFGWRVVGAVCGVAMIPVIYLLVFALTKNRLCGTVAAALTACDFMHITQTRIATVDTYVVLFMLLTFLFMAYYHNTPFGSKKEWLYLFLSGIFMGCAVASKWNGAYPMAGLAIFFFISLVCKYRSSENTPFRKKHTALTVLLCFVFFVAVPLAIYAASFIPVIHAADLKDYFAQLWNYQVHMFNYHSKLEAEHFFSSMWYSWPFSIKPIWYAISESGGMVSSISAFGNPVIWVFTPFAALYVLIAGIKERKLPYLMVALGYLASYLPWVMVSRLCFIYHYFPCAMFGIAAVAIAIKDIIAAKPAFRKTVYLYIGVCAVMFLLFLPVTCGLSAPAAYIDLLEVLPQWHFVNL